MDVGRPCGLLGAEEHARHQRIASYLKGICTQYSGMGFTAREEWVAEQTVQALCVLLSDVDCTEDERRAIEEFLALAGEELPGVP